MPSRRWQWITSSGEACREVRCFVLSRLYHPDFLVVQLPSRARLFATPWMVLTIPGVHPGSCRLNQWCSEDLEDPLPVHQCLRSQAGLSHSHGHPFSSKDAWPSSLAAAPDHPHVAGSPLLLSGLLSGPVASSLCQGCTWHPHSMAHGGPKSLGFWSHLAFTWGKGWFIYHLRKPLI